MIHTSAESISGYLMLTVPVFILQSGFEFMTSINYMDFMQLTNHIIN